MNVSSETMQANDNRVLPLKYQKMKLSTQNSILSKNYFHK